jgi:hypothetical protein
MPPADAGTVVGGKPIVVAGADTAATDEVGRWDHGGTSSGT